MSQKINKPIDRLEHYQQLSDDAAPSGERQNRVYLAAVEKWGVVTQVDMAIEECSELITALQHFKRGRVGIPEVAEEIADVEIMLSQLRVIFGDAAVDTVKQRKIERLRELVEG